MNQPWQAEIEIGADLAAKLIADQFPALRPVVLERLGEGWDNVVFQVNGDVVFRFPRRAIAVPFIRTERRVLPGLADLLPVSVPVPRYAGSPAAGYPWPFNGYGLLSGKTACTAALSDGQRTELARPLGLFLARLHRLRPDFTDVGAPGDTLGRADVARLRSKIGERLTGLDEALGAKGLAALRRMLTEAPDYRPRVDVLVHGDLYVRHLLVDERGRLTGVIDWGDVHLGDPAPDLSVAWSFLPPSAHGAFREAYGAIEPDTWAVARLRAIHYAVVLWRYGRDTRDRDLIRESRTIFRYLLA